MKAIKKINNNVAICIDDNDKELIAFGKGIGFPTMPYEIKDLKIIERTFYGVSSEYVGLIEELPKDVIDTANAITEYGEKVLNKTFSPNFIFTLADHINFAIERYKKNLNVKVPYIGNIKYLHEKEVEIGKKAVSYINKKHNVLLNKDEATSIALHFINAVSEDDNNNDLDTSSIIDGVMEVIEKETSISINRDGFNASRFETHLEYLIKRILDNEIIDKSNSALFEVMKTKYPKTYVYALKVKAYLENKLLKQLSDEEVGYLMLHINRLTTREKEN